MTYVEFINELQNYYFKYPEAVKNEIVGYIKTHYIESDLKHIYNYLLQNYSRQYKCTPDISMIREAAYKINVWALRKYVALPEPIITQTEKNMVKNVNEKVLELVKAKNKNPIKQAQYKKQEEVDEK